METRKLYYEDCMMREFTARVTACEACGDRWAVTLDKTAFFPEGGGQAWDTGKLGSVNVVETQERGEEVVHYCDGPLAVGEEVAGVIDWERRFDQMQQHTGEHILSGLIHKHYGYHNTGYHVGDDTLEVDFSGILTWEQAMALEREVNQAIWANTAIHAWIPTPEELPTVTYRTKRALPWPVRIVQIRGYDSCACCGVHVAQTGQVGLVKILSLAKFHGGTRFQMVCGGRAYRWMAKIFEENRRVSQAFSAKMDETGGAAQRMNELLAAQKARSAALEKQLFGYIAKSYTGRGDVLRFEEGLTPAGVRDLAETMAKECGGVAAVLTGEGESWQVCLVGPAEAVKARGAAMIQALGGRGGGKAGFFQGSIKASRGDIEGFFGL